MRGRLFEPLSLGARRARNRIVSTPHATGFARAGLITDGLVQYHARKAQGGVGLLMTFGSASVSPGSSAAYGSVALWDEANEPALRELARRAHEHDALIISQASHLGRRGDSRLSGIPLAAPTAVPEAVHLEIPHELHAAEIAAIVADFAAAARRLERCGFDGVEITSYGCHLIEQFWSPVVNRRTDAYGGDLQGRMRFSIEVLEAVSAAVSGSFLIAFRMTGDPLTDAVGLAPAEMCDIARRLAALKRIDIFDISGGTGATAAAQAATVAPDTFPTGCFNPLAHAIRDVVGVPVIAAGRNLDVHQAERALRDGDCDLVAMTRAIIADPDLPVKASHGELDRIRPCIAINDACIGRLYTGLPIRCAVNPDIGDDPPAQAPSGPQPLRRIVVVGGGPAGLEAARVAGLHGHRVTVLERKADVGGQVTLAAHARWRPHLADHVRWQARELARLAVTVATGVSADVAGVLELAPDAVIIATGAESILPAETKGATIACATDIDVICGTVTITPGAHVIIFDREGELRGGAAARLAAEAGAGRVELITPLRAACAELDPTQQPEMRRALEQAGVHCAPDLELAGVDRQLHLRSSWTGAPAQRDDVDLIVFVGYRAARDGLARELPSARPGLAITCVGDCVAPRRLVDAIAEGAAAATRIGR